MFSIKVVKTLYDLQVSKNESPVFLIAPIQFESDPPTGFYLKCPFCKKISTFQFSTLKQEKINCKAENCKLLIEIDEIRDKINLCKEEGD